MFVKQPATNWDRYFDGWLEPIARKSKDPKTKVGCVIVSEDHSPLTTGFNGFCRGVDETIQERWDDRATRYAFVEHAERNALYIAARNGIRLKDATAYVRFFPCLECFKGVIQSGLKEVRLSIENYESRQTELKERLSLEDWEKWEIERKRIITMSDESTVGIVVYE